ncbi:hypothetical protein STEG23_030901 [Scotinomys teguina]
MSNPAEPEVARWTVPEGGEMDFALPHIFVGPGDEDPDSRFLTLKDRHLVCDFLSVPPPFTIGALFSKMSFLATAKTSPTRPLATVLVAAITAAANPELDNGPPISLQAFIYACKPFAFQGGINKAPSLVLRLGKAIQYEE